MNALISSQRGVDDAADEQGRVPAAAGHRLPSRIRRMIARSRAGSPAPATPSGQAVQATTTQDPRLPRLMRHKRLVLRPVTVRRVFALIDEFRLQCSRNAGSEAIAQALSAVVDLAARALPRDDSTVRTSKRLGAENAYCLDELQGLLQALQANQTPAPFDLCHAMDSLIIQMVRMKPIWTATTRVHAAFRSLAIRSSREGLSVHGLPT